MRVRDRVVFHSWLFLHDRRNRKDFRHQFLSSFDASASRWLLKVVADIFRLPHRLQNNLDAQTRLTNWMVLAITSLLVSY